MDQKNVITDESAIVDHTMIAPAGKTESDPECRSDRSFGA